MAFSYAPSAAPPMSGLSGPSMPSQPAINYNVPMNYGGPLKSNLSYGDKSVDYGSGDMQQQQNQQSIDPQVVAKLMQQFMGSSGSSGASSSLLSQGSGSAGLGGSGLIGSAGGATSAASSGGASYGLGGSLVGGSGTVGGSTFAGSSAGGAAGGAAGGGGVAAGLGGLGALAGLSFLGDKEMNESKGSPINAEKINDIGTIGDTGIGLRGGDLVNGFNPATWVSDPGKAAKGLVNVFTLGFLNKWL